MNDKKIKEMRDKIIENFNVPGYTVGQDPEVRSKIKFLISCIRMRLKLSIMVIKYRFKLLIKTLQEIIEIIKETI